MAPCRRCGGFLRADDEGRIHCVACAREHNPPPIVPDSRWTVGGQPPPRPPSPKSGDHNAKPPLPSHPWREASGAHWANTEAAQVTLAALRRRRKAMAERRQGRKSKGKTHVAGRGGIGV